MNEKGMYLYKRLRLSFRLFIILLITALFIGVLHQTQNGGDIINVLAILVYISFIIIFWSFHVYLWRLATHFGKSPIIYAGGSFLLSGLFFMGPIFVYTYAIDFAEKGMGLKVKCPNCDSELRSNVKKCPQCGFDISHEKQTIKFDKDK
ncbi:MAG: zinc-ribbon domain-containing protein [Nitrospirota bacterium]